MGGFSTIPRMYLPSDALPPDMQDGSQMTGVDAPLSRIMTPPQPVSGHMAHVLSTADSMGGPVAPDPATIAAAMPPQPKVVQDQDPLHQREGHLTNQLQADYRKDANPWGSANNHPGLGGKIAHVLSRVGNIAGDIVAPGQMAMIPGTEQYRRNEEEGLARELSEVQGEESKNAYQDAQTAHTNAETPEVAPNAESERGLRKVQTETGQQALDQGPSLIQGHAHAVNQAIKAGRDPATDPLVMQYEDAIQRIQKQPAEKDVKVTEDLQNQIDAANQAGDTKKVKQLQQRLKDLNPGAEQRLQVTVQGQQAANERANNTVDRASVREHDKAYVQPAESTEKSYDMMNNAYNEYKALQKQGKDFPTGAQSMLALSTHLATTFGNVKGARVTKDMIREHLGARSLSDDATVAVQKLTNGDRLSPGQWDAFHDLIKQSRNLSWGTAVKEAARKHIPIDFLPDDLQKINKDGHDYVMGEDGKYHLAGGAQ